MDENQVYIAGPLFSEAERYFNLKLSAICEKLGYKVFLPQRDAPKLVEGNVSDVFCAELHALESAGLILANLDGVDVDSGAAWELGYATARGKSIIGIRTDWRMFSPNESVNLMIQQSCVLVKSIDQLIRALMAFKENSTDDDLLEGHDFVWARSKERR